jgi:hypothetical protein
VTGVGVCIFWIVRVGVVLKYSHALFLIIIEIFPASPFFVQVEFV